MFTKAWSTVAETLYCFKFAMNGIASAAENTPSLQNLGEYQGERMGRGNLIEEMRCVIIINTYLTGWGVGLSCSLGVSRGHRKHTL